MVWLPAHYDGNCGGNSGNNSVALTLICFLVKYFSSSKDEIFKDTYPEQDISDADFDFIIVGAGAAGCVIANRLTEQMNWKVLLLESGDEEPYVTAVPGLHPYLTGSSIDYKYLTNDSRSTMYFQGKSMGGSTAINGMLYARGSKTDYDGWANSGNKGWRYNDVLPYFKKSENARDPEILAKYPELHGTDGYLTVERYPYDDKSTPLFIRAYEEAGLKWDVDYNTGIQGGVYRKQYTSIHGTRLSANGAFIRPIRGKRSNLVIRLNSRVTKIIIDPVTKRATGVEYQRTNENGTTIVQVSAKKEVIVSCGFINSPKLLMLSGIGPKNDLEKLNITVIQDLSVGKNLQDHFATSLVFLSNKSAVIKSDETTKAELLEWINTHEGPQSARPLLGIEAFYRTKYENRTGVADIQYELRGGTQVDGSIANLTITAGLLAPKSRGVIKLNSINPVDYQPDIIANPASHPRDVEVLVEGLKFARKFCDTKTLKNAGFKWSTIPKSGCNNIDINSDDYLRCLIKATAQIYYHGSGTCKMGPKTDKNAVVDPTLKVHGIKGLRVIDASIMPTIIRGNTMAPTYMIAEKGSDMIIKEWVSGNQYFKRSSTKKYFE